MPTLGHRADCECPSCTEAIEQTEAISFESFSLQLADHRWVAIRFGVSHDGKVVVIRDIRVAVERGSLVEDQIVEKIIVLDPHELFPVGGLGPMPERPT